MRLAFLAEASALLSSSLDYASTLRSVARLAVPQLADWCAVHVVGEDGEVRQLAATHVDPKKVRLAEELARDFPFDPDARSGAALVLRTGQPELIHEIPDELLERLIPDTGLLQIVRDLGLRSSMVVPMVARGRTLGAITLISAESGRLFGPDDLALADELATRSAMAVDNARLHREVLETAAQRAGILDQIVEGIIIADAGGTTTFVNGAARRLIGVDHVGIAVDQQHEVYRLRNADGTVPDPRSLPLARAAMRGEIVRDEDLVIALAGSRTIIVQAGATPIVTDDGQRTGAVMSFRDVTVQRTLERQKDDFLSSAAHDLKNPLATVKSLSQMLQRRIGRGGEIDRDRLVDGLNRIDVTATKMASMVNELLDVARFEMGIPLELDRRTVDLVSLVAGIVDEHRGATERHHIRFCTSLSSFNGKWDGSRLERAVGNILSNAVKYSPDGGEIEVELARDTIEGAEWAILTVTDHGVGVPAADLGRIFEKFYRAGNVDGAISGTGLGLAGARQVIEQHGGAIEVQSAEGQGSTFTIRLPSGMVGAKIARNEGMYVDAR